MAHCMMSEDLVQLEFVAWSSDASLVHHLHWGQELLDQVKCSEVIGRIHLESGVETMYLVESVQG